MLLPGVSLKQSLHPSAVPCQSQEEAQWRNLMGLNPR